MKSQVNSLERHLADLDLLDPHDLALAARLFRQNETHRYELIKEYLTNRDFLEGGIKQWMSWSEDERRRKLDIALETGDELLITFNLILVQCEQLLSRLLRVEPIWEARPVGQDEQDIQASRRTTDVLGYYYRHQLRHVVLLARFILTAFCSPITWMTGGWDHNRGKIIRTTFEDFLGAAMEEAFPNGLDQAPPDLRQVVIENTQREFVELFGEDALTRGEVFQREGDLFTDIITVDQMNWYPTNPRDEKDVDLFEWTTIETCEKMAERYGLTLEEVRTMRGGPSPQKPGPKQGSMWNRRSLTNRRAPSFGWDDMDMIEHRRIYRRPCLKYPEGVFGVVLGNANHAIVCGPNNETIDHEPPFYSLVQHPLPDTIHGTCMVTQLRSMQMDINKAASQESLYRDQMIHHTIIIPEAGRVDEKQEFDNRPGATHLCTNKAEAPFILERPSVSLDYIRSIDRNVSFMREVASVSAIQVGNTDEAHVKSGRAIDKLSQETSERLLMFARRLNKNQEQVGEQLAGVLQIKPIGNRLAALTGENLRLEWFDWKADDLRPASFDIEGRPKAAIEVTAFADLPMSRTENMQYVIQLVTNGILQPGQNDAEIWRLIGSGDNRLVRDRDRKDRARQNWEISLWKKGQLCPNVVDEQSHKLHIEGITEWIRSGDEYEKTIRQFPYIETHIRMHMRQHWIADMKHQYKLMLLERRAKLLAWSETVHEIAIDQDKLAGALQGQLFSLDSIFSDPLMGSGLGFASAASVVAGREPPPQGMAAAVGGGQQQQGSAGAQSSGDGGKPKGEMSWEERDKRKDQSAAGTPRNMQTG